jgi:peptidoglycan hydrolase CwlO-like protein
MLKKIFWSWILLFILFILAVFNTPNIANSIANALGFPNLYKNITSIKWIYDTVVTDITSKEELEKQYNSTLSWALELKSNIIDWVQTTKNKVDSLRETLSWAEQKIEDIKESYEDAKEFIDETWKKIDEAKQIIEDTQAVIENVRSVSEFNN